MAVAATAQRDYHEVLGVPRDADEKTIKDAFRALALRYHPDRSKEPDATEHFKEVAAAFAVLSDPAKRAAYDAGGRPGISTEDLFGGVDFEEIFGGLGFDVGGGLFDRLFQRRPAGPARGENIEVTLTVPLDRIAEGGPETVRFTRPTQCTSCGGSGARTGTSPRACERCGGSGRLVTRRSERGVAVQQITTCTTCHGRGTFIDDPCPDCGGRGAVRTEDSLRVTIPPGIDDGAALRVPGRGLPSLDPHGEDGDLFVVVRTEPDERFERREAHLWRTETITVPDAALGTTLRIRTLGSPVRIRVKPGVQPGTVIRLAGKGLPVFQGTGSGDLYVRVAVSTPQSPSSEERALYEQLRALSDRQGP